MRFTEKWQNCLGQFSKYLYVEIIYSHERTTFIKLNWFSSCIKAGQNLTAKNGVAFSIAEREDDSLMILFLETCYEYRKQNRHLPPKAVKTPALFKSFEMGIFVETATQSFSKIWQNSRKWGLQKNGRIF